MNDPFAHDASYRPVPLDHRRLTLDERLARARAFLDTMRHRRSVRAFSTEAVPFALIEAAVAAAGSSPTAGARCATRSPPNGGRVNHASPHDGLRGRVHELAG